MNNKHLMVALTGVNVAMVAFNHFPTPVAAQQPPGLIRASGLEIVDTQGRVRASISVQPSTIVDGRAYPETVLLRLTDPRRGPIVKLTAAADGAALGLSNHAAGGIRVMAKEDRTFIEVSRGAGQTRMIEP